MPDGIVQAIGLPFKEAVDHFKAKLLLPASAEHASWTEVMGEAHARAFTVAGAASEALLADFQAEIAKALKNGTTLAEFRASFDDIVKRHGWQQRHEPGWRAQIIYETNMATAHAAGRYAQMTDPDVLEAYPYWQYVHSGSRHPRIQHLNWNGLTLAADDPWWGVHYPPNGWRCGCRVRPVSGPALRRSGRSGPDVAPANTYRPWTDKRTGQVHMVPNGIDPGWDYNVGRAWKQGMPREERASGVPTKPPPVAPPKPAPAPPAAVGTKLPPADRKAIESFIHAPHGELPVGHLAVEAQADLQAATDQVLLSAETLLKQRTRHPDVLAGDYADLPELLSAPDLVLAWEDRRILLLRVKQHSLAAVVKTTEDRQSNYVVSVYHARPRSVRALIRRARVVAGSTNGLE